MLSTAYTLIDPYARDHMVRLNTNLHTDSMAWRGRVYGVEWDIVPQPKE